MPFEALIRSGQILGVIYLPIDFLFFVSFVASWFIRFSSNQNSVTESPAIASILRT
jgi:hypothetical protein